MNRPQENFSAHLKKYLYFYVFILLALSSRPLENILRLCIDFPKMNINFDKYISANEIIISYSIALDLVILAPLFKKTHPRLSYFIFALGVTVQIMLITYFLTGKYYNIFLPLVFLIPIAFSVFSIAIFVFTKPDGIVNISKNKRSKIKMVFFVFTFFISYSLVDTVLLRLIPSPAIDNIGIGTSSVPVYYKNLLLGYATSYTIISFWNFYFYKRFMLRELSL